MAQPESLMGLFSSNGKSARRNAEKMNEYSDRHINQDALCTALLNKPVRFNWKFWGSGKHLLLKFKVNDS